MNFMLELQKIVLEALRKQAFPTILLFTAVLGLLYVVKDQSDILSAKMDEQYAELKTENNNLQEQLIACHNSNRDLALELAELKVQLRPGAYRKSH